MARGPRFGFYYAIASIPLMGAGILGPDVLPLSPEWKAATFYVCVALALLCVIVGAFKELQDETAEGRAPGHRRRMIAIVGMLSCGVGFVGFATAYFWPTVPKSAQHEPKAAASTTEPIQASQSASFESDLRRLTNEQLRSRTIIFTTRMRAFENDYATKRYLRSLTNILTRPPPSQNGETPEQAKDRWTSEVSHDSNSRDQERREFEMQFRSDALAYRAELLHRTGSPVDARSSALLEHGLLTGINPIAEAADSLDAIARKLSN
jgi:hypothetical protein